jgi:hypothetical protein
MYEATGTFLDPVDSIVIGVGPRYRRQFPAKKKGNFHTIPYVYTDCTYCRNKKNNQKCFFPPTSFRRIGWIVEMLSCHCVRYIKQILISHCGSDLIEKNSNFSIVKMLFDPRAGQKVTYTGLVESTVRTETSSSENLIPL